MAGDLAPLYSPQVISIGARSSSRGCDGNGNGNGNGDANFSPYSAESSFRELDDVFLQNQTRIWLGEVLQTRLNEQLHISDLLANGELLFEVSRVVSNMLLMRHMELTYVEAYKYDPFASRKRGGRYTPYSNVDSFLKICKILGLSGIDLFSPSDVVEKRNTRKVCICIRSLSKKARSRHLNVPDFDIVLYTVCMSTDMVQCIRRRLELSQCSRSSSYSHSLCQDSGAKTIQKGSVVAFKRNLGLCSEECDYPESDFLTSLNGSYDVSSLVESDFTGSPSACSVFKSCTSEQNSLDIQNHLRDEYTHHPFKSQCLEQPAESLCSRNVEHGYHLSFTSSPSSVVSLIDSSSKDSHVKCEFTESNEETSVKFDNVGLDLKSDASIYENSMGGNTTERSYTVDRLATSRIIWHGADISDLLLDREDSISTVSTTASSHGSNSMHKSSKIGCRRKLFDADDVEISSSSSTSSAGAVLNFDSDDQLDAEDNEKSIQSTRFQNDEAYRIKSNTTSRYESRDVVSDGTLLHSLTLDPVKPYSDMEVIDVGLAKLFRPCSNAQSYTSFYSDYSVSIKNGSCRSQSNAEVVYDDNDLSEIASDASKKEHCDQCEEILLGGSYSPLDFHLWDHKGKCAAMMSNENGGHGVSLLSSSPEGLHDVISKEAEGDTLRVKVIESDVADGDKANPRATIVESYVESHHHLQRSAFDNVVTHGDSNASPHSTVYKEIENSSELQSQHDDNCMQHCDVLIEGFGGQVSHIADTVVSNPGVHHNVVIPPKTSELSAKHSCSPTECLENVDGNSPREYTGPESNFLSCTDSVDKLHDQDGRTHGKVDMPTAEKFDDEDARAGTAEWKPQKRPLLKSVVQGTAIVGVIFLLLRLGKSNREEAGEPSIRSNQIRKANIGKLSSPKGHRGNRTNGVYPAEKLKLGK